MIWNQEVAAGCLKKIQLQTNNWPTDRLKVLRHGYFIKKAAIYLFSYAEAIFNQVVFTMFLHICMSQPQSSCTGNVQISGQQK